MAHFPIAVLYNEWGVPAFIRYAVFSIDGDEYEGYWYSGVVGVSMNAESQFITPSTKLCVCTKDIAVDTVVSDEFWTGSGVKRRSDAQFMKRGFALTNVTSITEITCDGHIHNDTLQILAVFESYLLLVIDHRGNFAWKLFDVLFKGVYDLKIKLSGYTERTPITIRENTEYRTSSAQSIIDVAVSSAELANYSCHVDLYRGVRVLKLNNAVNAIVSDFWNVVRHVDKTLENLSCPDEAAVFIRSLNMKSFKAPRVCTGFNVECFSIKDLVLPMETRELHKGGGVLFILDIRVLPSSLTTIDMSGWHDIAVMSLVASTCYLQRVSLMLPREASPRALESPELAMSDRSNPHYVSSLVLRNAPCLEYLKLLSEVYPTCGINYTVELGSADKLTDIDIVGACELLTFNFSGGLRSVVTLTLHRGCDIIINLQNVFVNPRFKIVLASDFDNADWCIQFEVFRMKSQLVSGTYDFWIDEYDKPVVGKPTLLVCCPAEHPEKINIRNLKNVRL